MASFKISILLPTGTVEVTVNATSYEEGTDRVLHFYKGSENRKVASFRNWDFITLVDHVPEVPTP